MAYKCKHYEYSRKDCSCGSDHYDPSLPEAHFDRYTTNLWELEIQLLRHVSHRYFLKNEIILDKGIVQSRYVKSESESYHGVTSNG